MMLIHIVCLHGVNDTSSHGQGPAVEDPERCFLVNLEVLERWLQNQGAATWGMPSLLLHQASLATDSCIYYTECYTSVRVTDGQRQLFHSLVDSLNAQMGLLGRRTRAIIC